MSISDSEMKSYARIMSGSWLDQRTQRLSGRVLVWAKWVNITEVQYWLLFWFQSC